MATACMEALLVLFSLYCIVCVVASLEVDMFESQISQIGSFQEQSTGKVLSRAV